MNTLSITISKSRVLDEVAKTSAYIGAKMMSGDDPVAYERIATTDADREQLERYWMECCADMASVLNGWVSYAGNQGMTHHVEIDRDFEMSLRMTDNWNDNLGQSINDALTSYMIDGMVAKWCMLANKKEAEAYTALAASSLQQARAMTFMRVRPTRRVNEDMPLRDKGCFDTGIWLGGKNWRGSDIWKNN